MNDIFLCVEDFMRTDRTKKILSNGDFMGMMNIVMQLRKVCNHPDLFEGRAIRSPFTLSPLRYTVPSLVANDTIVDKGFLFFVHWCSAQVLLHYF